MKWSIYERQPEEDAFRQVPEGWIFTIGGPWSYLKWSYLVNDAQKAELLARIGRWRFAFFVLFTAMIVALAAISESLSLSGTSDWIRFATFAAVFSLLFFLLVFVAMPYIQLFILRPILTGAVPATLAPTPTTSTRIGFWDSLLGGCRVLARTFSSRFLIFACLLFGFLSIKSGYDAFTSKADYAYPIAWAFFDAMNSSTFFFVVFFGVALFLKLREGRSHE
jgi:hypothetical protein